MTAIIFPHVCCNGGIITDLSGYGCIPGNLGLGEIYATREDVGEKLDKSKVTNSLINSRELVPTTALLIDNLNLKQEKGDYATADELKKITLPKGIRNGRIEYDAGASQIPSSFMTIKKVITQGGIVTYASDRTRGVDHGDIAWSVMNVLYAEPIGSESADSGSCVSEF